MSRNKKQAESVSQYPYDSKIDDVFQTRYKICSHIQITLLKDVKNKKIIPAVKIDKSKELEKNELEKTFPELMYHIKRLEEE